MGVLDEERVGLGQGAFETDLKLSRTQASGGGFLEFGDTWGHGPRKNLPKKETGSGHIWGSVASKMLYGGTDLEFLELSVGTLCRLSTDSKLCYGPLGLKSH